SRSVVVRTSVKACMLFSNGGGLYFEEHEPNENRSWEETVSVKPIILGLLAALSIVATSASVSAQARTPRTPWGDPDLQGTYTNKYEQGTPFERPAEFAGKRMEDITPEELKQVAKRRQEQTLERAPYFG